MDLQEDDKGQQMSNGTLLWAGDSEMRIQQAKIIKT